MLDVALPLLSLRNTYRFAASGETIPPSSTLRLRDVEETRASLAAAGYAVLDVRRAPDRPGREHVYLARPTEATMRR